MTYIIERALLDHIRVETYNSFTNPFTLDRSRLEFAALGGPASVGTWQDWAGQVIAVTSRRGGIREGITIRNEPGLLTVQIRDLVVDTIEPEMLPDQPFRLVLDLPGGSHVLFTGRLRDLTTEYRMLRAGRPPVPVTTVIAVDAVSEHDAVTRYGAVEAAAETFPARINRLRRTATAPLETPAFLDVRGTPVSPITLGRTTLEASVSEHLTLACNTVRAMWWVGTDGVTRFAPRAFDEASAVEFTGQPYSILPDPLHHLSHVLENGTQALFNIEVARNLGAVLDGTEWQPTEEIRALNIPNPLTVPMGRRRVTFDTNAADTNDLASLVAGDEYSWISAYRSMTDKASSLRWNAQEDLTRIPQLDIGRSVYFNLPGVVAAAHSKNIIAGVAHTITPTRWITDLTLIGA